MKSEKRIKARELRSQGMAIKKIAEELNVSPSSISLWVRDIALSTEQIEFLKQQNPIFNNQLHGSKVRAEDAREIRLEYQMAGRLQAKKINLLHQAGCMLFWAEGKKNKNTCSFTNSDAEMIKLFIKFLRECFYVTNDKITLTINCYTTNGLSKENIENYWLSILQLDFSSLRKGQENLRPRSATNAVRHHKLLYGVVCLSVNSTEIVQHIYGAIQEYAGFNNNFMLM